MLVLSSKKMDKGDELALLEQLYLSYKKSMLYVAYQILESSTDAEDAVHSAFEGIAKNLDTVRCMENERGRRNYVLKAAQNAAYNYIKKFRRWDTETVDPYDMGRLVDDNEQLTTDFLSDLEVDYVSECIDKLKPKYKNVLYLRYGAEMEINEIAKLYGKDRSTVAKCVKRAIQLLKEIIEEGGAKTDE